MISFYFDIASYFNAIEKRKKIEGKTDNGSPAAGKKGNMEKAEHPRIRGNRLVTILPKSYLCHDPSTCKAKYKQFNMIHSPKKGHLETLSHSSI